MVWYIAMNFVKSNSFLRSRGRISRYTGKGFLPSVTIEYLSDSPPPPIFGSSVNNHYKPLGKTSVPSLVLCVHSLNISNSYSTKKRRSLRLGPTCFFIEISAYTRSLYGYPQSEKRGFTTHQGKTLSKGGGHRGEADRGLNLCWPP
jgi:hypothetical protein